MHFSCMHLPPKLGYKCGRHPVFPPCALPYPLPHHGRHVCKAGCLHCYLDCWPTSSRLAPPPRLKRGGSGRLKNDQSRQQQQSEPTNLNNNGRGRRKIQVCTTNPNRATRTNAPPSSTRGGSKTDFDLNRSGGEINRYPKLDASDQPGGLTYYRILIFPPPCRDQKSHTLCAVSTMHAYPSSKTSKLLC